SATYTVSLRAALPIFALYEKLPGREPLVEAELYDALGDALGKGRRPGEADKARARATRGYLGVLQGPGSRQVGAFARSRAFWKRSEEHTSELQSRGHL